MQSLLNTHKTKFIHSNLHLLNLFNLISGGGVSLRGPYTRKTPVFN